MNDYFTDTRARLLRHAQDVMKIARIGDKEWQIFLLFYNETFKKRREVLPQFQIFGTLCDGKDDGSWPTIMLNAEKALLNLEEVGWIEKANLSVLGNLAHEKVGPAIRTYKLTARGLDVLQEIHPPISLQLRGWIAVMPPWVVLTGSIAGGVAAVWKIGELVWLLFQ